MLLRIAHHHNALQISTESFEIPLFWTIMKLVAMKKQAVEAKNTKRLVDLRNEFLVKF